MALGARGSKALKEDVVSDTQHENNASVDVVETEPSEVVDQHPGSNNGPDASQTGAGAVNPGTGDTDALAENDSAGDSADEDSAGDEDENPLETEAEIAADYLEELLDIADLDGDIDTYIEGNRAHVSIVSDSEALVGAGGQVLDSLQELARLAVMTETGDRSRLMLDIAGYRDRRRKQLITLATDAVAEVTSTQEPLALAPMNPFERKIVHDAVAAAGLTSASEGEEPKRRVVVRPTA